MEFTVSKMMLFNALSHFQSVVEKRNTIPILSNVKVKTHSNKIEITATDLALEITEVIDAKVIQEGELTVPSQMFFDIIRKAPEKCIIEIKQDLDLGQMFIFFGDSKFSLSYLPTSDFPQMENESLENIISISSQDFSYLIDDTKFSMGLDESRQYLNGIYFHQTEGFLTCVATDGHRLSRCQIIKDADLKNFDGIIIPKKNSL